LNKTVEGGASIMKPTTGKEILQIPAAAYLAANLGIKNYFSED
jgi:hypothetical protein